MARIRLTRKLVEELECPSKGQKFAWDSEVPGFGVRATPSGTKAWIAQFKVRGGKERRMVIGLTTKVPLELARQEARKVIATADLGRDPAAERKEARQVKPESNPFFGEFSKRWLTDVAGNRNRESTLKHRRLLLQNHICPQIGGKRLQDIRRETIELMHLDISKSKPVVANRAVSLCSAIFAAAVRWGLLCENPASDIERNPEHGRERYLTLDELKRLNAELAATPAQDSADAVRILLLTGSRVAEVLSMRWDQLDLDNGVWTKPAATTKQNKLHRVPLAPPAIQLLKMRRKKLPRSSWVFPSSSKQGHMTTIRRFWASTCKLTKIKGARIHDLRHTFASLLISSGETLPIVGALLGHTQAKTTSRYAHLMDDPLREAAVRIGKITNIRPQAQKRKTAA
ncbi:MAG: tyrosine-type recombinase/integrase [Ferrovibrio sp.]|uniref:tyrosine-type recombinase/integrase n=1 Tax=Ferrovibrio sp. TaxID=1917215 RepID=UPI00391A0C6B